MSKKGMRETVEPIKSNKNLHKLEAELSKGSTGTRDLTIWEVSKDLLLRASDTLKLKYNQVFTSSGNVKSSARTYDKKTGKVNILGFKKLAPQLLAYNQWRKQRTTFKYSQWLFPATRNPQRHLSRCYWYHVLRDEAHWIGLKHIGSHSARKTGAYIVYKKTGNIALVMRLLNQSSEEVTLRYLGVPRTSAYKVLSNIDMDNI